MHWQLDLLERLRTAAPTVRDVRPYGSVTTPDHLDRWSDLDVELDLTSDADAGQLFDGTPWAWQDTRDRTDPTVQRLRLVLADGRRVDAAVRGGTVRLPEPSPDNAVRFDLALAATRFGRGADLIGLHLVLGVVRSTLELWMAVEDRHTGTTHHRSGSATDAAAARALAALAGPLGPATVLQAAALHDEARAALQEAARAEARAALREAARAAAHDDARADVDTDAPTPDWTALRTIVGQTGTDPA